MFGIQKDDDDDDDILCGGQVEEIIIDREAQSTQLRTDIYQSRTAIKERVEGGSCR